MKKRGPNVLFDLNDLLFFLTVGLNLLIAIRDAAFHFIRLPDTLLSSFERQYNITENK